MPQAPGGSGRSGGEEAPRPEVQVARGGGEVAVAEEFLDRRHVAAGFEQMGRDGVAQSVDPALLGDPGAELGHRVELLGHGDVDRARALAIGEEPDLRGPDAPVRAPVLEQPLRERHIAILAALPWAMWIVRRSASRTGTLMVTTSLTRRPAAYVVANTSRSRGCVHAFSKRHTSSRLRMSGSFWGCLGCSVSAEAGPGSPAV